MPDVLQPFLFFLHGSLLALQSCLKDHLEATLFTLLKTSRSLLLEFILRQLSPTFGIYYSRLPLLTFSS